MYKSFIISLVLAFICFGLFGKCALQFSPVQNPRIVGGTTNVISNTPYLVQLRVNGEFSCGGSLVTQRHVVTAAHCTVGHNSRSIIVVGGATYLTDTGVRRNVERIFTSSSFQARTLNMDVSVLKLSTPMTGANIKTIQLCNSNWKVGDQVTVSGWGLTTESNKNPSNRIRTVNLPLISKKDCKSKYGSHITVTKSMFCTLAPGKDACSGDSGGPAVFKGQLCGIVSWGAGCARKNTPGVFTSVKYVKPFIDKSIKI
ncbi:seminase-like [Teleopsis dalmanni]|uniref:seminase-like n=1 Tax=Teleopsis dalmanni TaxID=139649 RepID=UPI0018CFA914|nr:seminase-like [Teleopsis dalmanni]